MSHLPADSIVAANSSPEVAGAVDAPAPLAVLEGVHVIDACARARAGGVHVGMSAAAATALVPGLVVVRRRPDAERQMLEALAACACLHTPKVVLASACEVLLELHGSLRLFGGLERIVARLRAMIDRLGLTARMASAPNARAARWLAAVHEDCHPASADGAWERTLERLPLHALQVDDTLAGVKAIHALEQVGARTVADLLRFPRAGFARRFGAMLLLRLDEATGRQAMAHRFFVPPERFESRLELTHMVDDAAALVFAFRRLLVQLEGFLQARASATDRIVLELLHDEGALTAVVIEMATAERSAEHFAMLAREHLERLALRAPAVEIRVRVDTLCRMPEPSQNLFPDAVGVAQDIDRLVDRLQARLGADAVHGLRLVDDHRPEHASVDAPFKALRSVDGTLVAAGRRPVWLLRAPRPLREVANRLYLDRQSGFDHQSPLSLLAGPERIESGWWDGADVMRDYFLARSADQALLWIYRSRSIDAHWFLHGVFA